MGSALILSGLLTFGFWPMPESGSAGQALETQADKPYVSEQALRPNIVLIVADDLGWSNLSCYGGDVPTPHIDSLAGRGVKCTQGYVTAPVCSPSRAGLLTGVYPQRYGYEYQIHNRYPRNRFETFFAQTFMNMGPFRLQYGVPIPDDSARAHQGLPPNQTTAAQLLRNAGYATALIGKWHLGEHATQSPKHFGFDYFYGFKEAYTLYADPSDQAIVNYTHPEVADEVIWKKGRTGSSAIVRNEVPIQEAKYLTFAMAREASKFITEHRKGPFFLYLPFSAPHTPFQALKKYYDKLGHITDDNRRVYAAMIQAMDEAVGRVVRTLDSLQLTHKTLIFFVSDNGGATYTHAMSNAPLRGGKMSLFEGGIRVPYLVNWPGHIPAGTAYTHPVSTLDVTATLLTAAHVSATVIDGVSLLPRFRKEGVSAPHEALFWRSGHCKAVRAGKYKLIVSNADNATWLFDMETDAGETRNIELQKPEVVSALKQQLAAWESGLVPPAWPTPVWYRTESMGEVMHYPI